MRFSMFLGRATLALSLALVLAYGTTAHNASAVTASADIFATVVAPLQLTKTSDLDFGTFSENGGGPIEITPAGAANDGANITRVASDPVSAACFDVVGDFGATYTIGLPGNSVVVLTGPGGATMPVNLFGSDPVSPAVLDGAGLGSFCVGATLTVNAGQAPGPYTGAFDVTVDYQ